jgi:hypothetical protein
VTGFPKATYMYWQKRFERTNPDEEIESIILGLDTVEFMENFVSVV